jgi:alpha-D-ribose 1-methylphosphonate 5-triphosphate synthase subunit PhnH
MMPSTSEHVMPGFQDPALGPQAVFRELLKGMSHPGRILSMPPVFDTPPPGLDPAAAAVCLTLLDGDTPLWTDLDGASPALAWLRFHCGCPLVEDAGRALFGLAAAAQQRLPSLEAFRPGSHEAPETAATVILQVEALVAARGGTLSGPGIPDRRSLEVVGLPPGFWEQRRRMCSAFPLGLDIILVCGAQLAVLPRSTRVEV